MNWKHIKNIDKSRGFAEIFIYDEIATDKVNGASIAYEMRYLMDYENIRVIKVKINSVGGDVMHAQTVVSAIIDAEEKGVTVETYGQGLMASSAGIIFLTAKKKNRYMKDYARLMIHGVSAGDPSDLNENDKTALENFKGMLVQILSNRTSKKESYFEDLFTNGKDNWFNAKEMVKNGFILKENIEITNITVDIPENETAAGVVVVYNKLTTEIENINQTQIKMKKVIALLHLQEGVSEEVVETAVLSVQNKLKTTESTLSEVQNKLQKTEEELNEAKAKISAQNKLAAADFVKNCIANGQIDPAKEAEVLIQAEANLEGFKNLISAIPVKAANIINKIGLDVNNAANPVVEVKSFRQLERESPEVLNAMKATDKPRYVALYNAQYKTNKTEEDFK